MGRSMERGLNDGKVIKKNTWLESERLNESYDFNEIYLL